MVGFLNHGLLKHQFKIGQPTGEYSGGTPLTSDVTVGTGQLDFQKIIRAAMQIGIKYYFIEDENAEVKIIYPSH